MMECRLWTAIFGVGYFDVDGWPLPLLTPFRPFIAVVYRCGEPYDEDGREGSVELSLGMLAWHERFGDDGKNPTRLLLRLFHHLDMLQLAVQSIDRRRDDWLTGMK